MEAKNLTKPDKTYGSKSYYKRGDQLVIEKWKNAKLSKCKYLYFLRKKRCNYYD